MVTCSSESLVILRGTPSQSLSGTLSSSIGNLTNLHMIQLQNNNITGPIPAEIGKLSKLQTLDLSNNIFTGTIPPALSHLRTLQYMRLNNNSLTGEIPMPLANMTQLSLVADSADKKIIVCDEKLKTIFAGRDFLRLLV